MDFDPAGNQSTAGMLKGGFAALRDDAIRAAKDANARVYVVVDGARFDDLPLALGRLRLAHQPLYLGPDRDFMAAGPFLIDLYSPPDNAAGKVAVGLSDIPGGSIQGSDVHTSTEDVLLRLERLLGFVEPGPGFVFWIGPSAMTADALYGHLRKLNKVLIPQEETRTIEPLDITAPASNSSEEEAVLFRHADGNVLAEIMPVLSESQYDRLLGPAMEIMFLAPDHPANGNSILYRAQSSTGGLPSSPGMMRFSPTQMLQIQAMRREGSNVRILRFLETTAPQHLKNSANHNKVEIAGRYSQLAGSLGITEERAQARFAWLMLCSGDRFMEQPGVRSYLTPSSNANRRLHLFAEAMLEGASSRRAE